MLIPSKTFKLVQILKTILLAETHFLD